MTVADVRLGAGKSKGLNVPEQPIGRLAFCCTRGSRIMIALDARSSDPGCKVHPEPGKCRLKAEEHHGMAADTAENARGPGRMASDQCRPASRVTVPPQPPARRPRARPDRAALDRGCRSR